MHDLDSKDEVWTVGSNFAIALARVLLLGVILRLPPRSAARRGRV